AKQLCASDQQSRILIPQDKWHQWRIAPRRYVPAVEAVEVRFAACEASRICWLEGPLHSSIIAKPEFR
ncbi:hypothetical protein, partial [Mesorhizobium sp. M2A.F.Ca.ET.067.02.1.1]|uniref:hypothetical protein n=1 Tax=Mesorhizobium sp. M2A.F.Ca.ET.067.02.1.1 TaxID=2496749 RepID=UPI001AECDF6F